MNIHNLDTIFKPKRIALIGINRNPKSVGGAVLSNIINSGFRGVVYPINTDSEAVLGIQCYQDLDSLPKKPKMAIICSPAVQVPEIVRQCGEYGINGIVILSAGFREAGNEGKLIEQQALQTIKQYKQMRVMGPNCLGIISPYFNLNASFASTMPKKGHIAFISQSGALCTSVLDWASEENIGFSYFVSIGNSMDIDFGDLIDYFGEDDKTDSIILYVESIKRVRKFMTASRAFARNKPIIAYKAGRFPESALAAASHTGAMTTEDDIYEAAFQRAGIMRVNDISEIFDCAELIGRHKTPRDSRLAIITNAGGPGVMATDALIARNGVLAQLSESTLDSLSENLPSCWSKGNPVDVLGDAKTNRIKKATQIVLDDSGVDAVLVILTPQSMTNPTGVAKAISSLAQNTRKPILATWLGGQSMREGIRILTQEGIPTFKTPEEAVRAFMVLVSYARNQEKLCETPRDTSVIFPIKRQEIRRRFFEMIPPNDSILTEDISKQLLHMYGIPVSESIPTRSVREAIITAEKIGFPVVMKVKTRDITHKSDVGGVILNVTGEQAVRIAYHQIIESVKAKAPDAYLDGVTVQKMYQSQAGVELILGLRQDPVFGSVLLVGAGGTNAELFNDRVIEFPPLNERLAYRMLESLRVWSLLQGYRGKPKLNIDKLIEAIMRLSYLITDFPDIVELDINPLLVTPENVSALDARVMINRNLQKDSEKPYSHLALRPYPEELVKRIKLSDGTSVTLRPIKPEDEPMWFDMLGNCSPESIYMRFRYAFHWATHDVASRFCFIDYDRELAIVAELNESNYRQLVGVGRLIADPDLTTAEYAILICDEWQNKGLGGILTDYCTEIAITWGVKEIVAQTTSDNNRMIELFKGREFETVSSDSVVDVRKKLN